MASPRIPLLLAASLAALLLPRLASAQAAPPPKPEPMQIGVEALLAGTARLNDTPSGHPVTERQAVGYQIGALFALNRKIDLGLSYAHTGVGVENEHRVGTSNGTETRYLLDTAGLEGRFFPLRGEWARLFLGLQATLGWQSLDHRATVLNQQTVSAPLLTSTRCEASSSSPVLGLGAALGADFDLGGGTFFVLRAAGSTHRLSSSTLNDGDRACAVGAGSTAIFQAQLGFQYRFDLGSGASSAPRTALASTF